MRREMEGKREGEREKVGSGWREGKDQKREREKEKGKK